MKANLTSHDKGIFVMQKHYKMKMPTLYSPVTWICLFKLQLEVRTFSNPSDRQEGKTGI